MYGKMYNRKIVTKKEEEKKAKKEKKEKKYKWKSKERILVQMGYVLNISKDWNILLIVLLFLTKLIFF